MSSSAPTGAQTAVVTGAGGFLGSHLAAQLLEAGWSVRAAVRDPADAARLGPLVALAAALPGSLTLHRADLLAPGSFDDVVAGADVVFHAASPFAFAVPDDEVLRPAVEGTRNVMAACAKAAAAAAASAAADGAAAAARPRLRVVLTSSAAAVKGKAPRPPVNGVAYTEEDWNDTSTVEGGEAYWVSKTTAERLAWDAARAAGLDLVTICPEFIIGPPLHAGAARGSVSVGYVAGWLRGEAGGSWLTFAADVRDVARAHVLAALHPAAPGQRYVVARPAASSPSEVAALLSARFPGLLIPAPGAAALAAPPPAHPVDASKVARELGLALRPLAETLADAAVAVIRLGLAVPRLREPPPAEAADGAAAAPRA